MKNYKKILIIILVILTLGIAYKYYKKAKDTEKLKLASVSLKTENKIDTFGELAEIFQNGLILKGFITVRNFSDQDYQINQLSVDGFTPKTQKNIAQQTNILQNAITVKAKQETAIPLQFKVDAVKALDLFKESGVIPEDYTIWQIITHPLEAYEIIKIDRLKILLKGFIEAEGITLNINQEISLYN